MRGNGYGRDGITVNEDALAEWFTMGTTVDDKSVFRNLYFRQSKERGAGWAGAFIFDSNFGASFSRTAAIPDPDLPV